MDVNNCEGRLLEFSRLMGTGLCNSWEGKLKTGVDLGTANIVLAVVDEHNRPVAGASYSSTVIRDGVVVDYIGAIRVVQKLREQMESKLGVPLVQAACAIPPGVPEGSVKAIGNVVEAADFQLTAIVDEPTAAATALGVDTGAVVDVGGGTTGISILENGKVVFTGDEPTGGIHMTLVLAGFKNCSVIQAETYKTDPVVESNVFSIIKPVVEKMASIVQKYIDDYPVKSIYIVGGACSFSQFAPLFERQLGIPVYKPAAPLYVTPLGIAMNCRL